MRPSAAVIDAAYLAAGDPCAVSHEAAARLLGLAGFDGADVVLNVPRGAHHRIRGARIHQISDMFDRTGHIERVDRLPVTTIARTFVDLSGVVRRGRLDYAFEEATSARLTTVDEVAAVTYALARPGKPGLRNIVRVIARHQPSTGVPGSQLERKLLTLLRSNGEPMPSVQVPFRRLTPSRRQ